MYHFVALIWNAHNAGTSAVAAHLDRLFRRSTRDWTRLVCTDGMIVYSQLPQGRSLRPYTLPINAGVILGRVFPADVDALHAHWTPTFDERTAVEMVRTGGRYLVENYWGNYVAFLGESKDQRFLVLRDCSGKIPCYRMRHDQVEIVFSDIADLSNLNLPPFSVNKKYLAAFVHSPDLQIRDCGLNEVTEILAGECLEIRQGVARQFSLWDPKRICTANAVDGYEEAISKLRRTTQGCIDAWASTFDSILHYLSGGLDSAIVLGCMHKSSTRSTVTCVNMFTEHSCDDERSYARLAAERAGVRLIEEYLGSRHLALDTRLLGAPKAPKPSIQALTTLLNKDGNTRIATDLQPDVIWTGEGGDHLFLQHKTDLSAADHLARYGISHGLPSAIADAARLSRRSYVSVLRSAWTLSRPRASWAPDRNSEILFANEEALPFNIVEYLTPPWSADAETLPKGKQLQIYFLADVLNRERRPPRVEHLATHHPLLSQPLIELCLQIPTYLLVQGGRQRGLARDAFLDRVPMEILRREDKGTGGPTVMDVIRKSEDFMQDIVMDGILVRERIVNREGLEPYVAQKRTTRPEHLRPLLACIAGEAWIRSWNATALRVAA